MKKLTCEMCGGSDMIKQDGMWVCQTCGCKYSVEEAKKMMIEGPVDVSGSTVKVDNSSYVKKQLENARRAYQKEDWEEVEKYYNKVEENDPSNIEAIFYSSYGKAKQSLIDSDKFKRAEAFKVLNNSISIIDDNFDKSNEGENRKIINRISDDIIAIGHSDFVYQTTTKSVSIGNYEVPFTVDNKKDTYSLFEMLHNGFIVSIFNIIRKFEYEEIETAQIYFDIAKKHANIVSIDVSDNAFFGLLHFGYYKKLLEELEEDNVEKAIEDASNLVNNDYDEELELKLKKKFLEKLKGVKGIENKNLFDKVLSFAGDGDNDKYIYEYAKSLDGKDKIDELYKIIDYKDSKNIIYECAKSLDEKEQIEELLKIKDYKDSKNIIYENAKNLSNKEQKKYLMEISDYKDSQKIIDELQNEEDKKNKSARKKAIITFSILASALAILLVVFNFVIPQILYNNAVKLYNEGNYYESCKIFNSIKYFSNSNEWVLKNCEVVRNVRNKSELMSVKFGDIEWYVLDRKSDRALLISKNIVEHKAYNNKETDITWEDCSLRKYLNNDFLNKHFNEEEKNKIELTDVINKNNSKYGTKGGNNTKDKIFLLSIDEANNYFPSDEMRATGDRYWLRSPGRNQSHAAGVYGDGSVYDYGDYVDYSDDGIRPALWVLY